MEGRLEMLHLEYDEQDKLGMRGDRPIVVDTDGVRDVLDFLHCDESHAYHPIPRMTLP